MRPQVHPPAFSSPQHLVFSSLLMKLSLDAHFDLEADGKPLASRELAQRLARGEGVGDDVSALEGRLVLLLDGKDVFGEYAEPLVRLLDSWLRKLPWVISGDTETVALRNTEQCFAFVPAAESVEISFFHGSEAEIEDYVTEPFNVRLDLFVKACFAVGERVVAIVRAADARLEHDNEDCRDLVASLAEAQKAWHDYELHNRR